MRALTPREREVATLIGEGWDVKATCGRLSISPKTYEAHVRHIADKLGYVADSGYVLRVIIARWAWTHIARRWEANT